MQIQTGRTYIIQSRQRIAYSKINIKNIVERIAYVTLLSLASYARTRAHPDHAAPEALLPQPACTRVHVVEERLGGEECGERAAVKTPRRHRARRGVVDRRRVISVAPTRSAACIPSVSWCLRPRSRLSRRARRSIRA